MASRPQRAKSAHSTITEARKRAFLADLAKHGVYTWAATTASPNAQDRHGAASSFRSLEDRDPLFRAQVAAAREEADAALERAAYLRAVEGTERAVYQKGEQARNADGSPAFERTFSDQLLALLMRSRIERFRDKKLVEVSGSIVHAALTLAPSDLLALDPAQRTQLAGILRTIARARGEVAADAPALPSVERVAVAEVIG